MGGLFECEGLLILVEVEEGDVDIEAAVATGVAVLSPTDCLDTPSCIS